MASKRTQKRPQRRRKSRDPLRQILRVLLSILLVLLLLAGGLFLFIQVKLGQINRIFPGQPGSSSSENWEEQDWDQAGIATSVKGVANVLLVGQDTRSGERERSDSMIIISVNKNTDQITMVSLMRDLYVDIPGYGMCKLNAAYQFGGFELLDQTIAENLGVFIDYNVEVDFSGFKDIVNTLGGIDVELNAEEAEYLNGGGVRWTNGRVHDVQEGWNHLDGEAALDYARMRHVGNADFDRTNRQRVVLNTIFDELKDANWFKLLEVYDSVAANITTDMNNTQILNIAFSAYSMKKQELNSYRIPADNMYTDSYIDGWGEVLEVNDWDATRELLWDYLYSTDGGVSADAALHEDSSASTDDSSMYVEEYDW